LTSAVDGLVLHDLRVADGSASLQFTRRGEAADTEVIAAAGELEVVLQ
jgi:hypothetical protein